MPRWWKQNAVCEAQETCRLWFRAAMHRLLAYARLQVDADTDVEMLLSGVMTRVAEAVAEGRVPAQEEDLLRYSMRAIWHDALRLRERNAHRREAEKQFSDRHAPEPTEPHPCMAAEDARVRASRLRQAVQLLPAEQAELVNLHIWQELSFAEIARRWSLPESTLRSRYAVALRTVKSHLEHIELC